MSELVFWSFVLALLPVVVSIFADFLAAVGCSLGWLASRQGALHKERHPIVFQVTQRVGRIGGCVHGR